MRGPNEAIARMRSNGGRSWFDSITALAMLDTGAVQRRARCPCRKLRPSEIKGLEIGKPVLRY